MYITNKTNWISKYYFRQPFIFAYVVHWIIKAEELVHTCNFCESSIFLLLDSDSFINGESVFMSHRSTFITSRICAGSDITALFDCSLPLCTDIQNIFYLAPLWNMVDFMGNLFTELTVARTLYLLPLACFTTLLPGTIASTKMLTDMYLAIHLI